jgi:SAM-dependent methyltransferase
MKVHSESLPDVTRYIQTHTCLNLQDKTQEFERIFRFISTVRPPGPETRILEIGVGTGWFPLLCMANGLNCKGLEISRQLIDVAMETGRANGLVPDIELGNVEETDLGTGLYDVVVASSVFEHIEFWLPALQKIYAALKPGGMLFFESSNKFSIISVEYRKLPFYGWLPDRLRYRFRVLVQGPDIMKLGIDFNQFTYPGLRRVFGKLGFRTIYDRVDLAQPDRMSAWKRTLMALAKRNALARALLLSFVEATTFVCVK